jgi:hypothetical protein
VASSVLTHHFFDSILGQRKSKFLSIDLYAGCPGFNVAVELVFKLSLSGVLKKDEFSVMLQLYESREHG